MSLTVPPAEPLARSRFRTALVRILRPALREWILPLVLLLGITTPLRSALADWYQVPTGSMKPTIIEGDRILVNNLAFGLRVPFTAHWITRWAEPRRGDIVTLSSPADGQRLVKRVVGLPGDRVGLRGGRLFLNGDPVPCEPEGAPGAPHGAVFLRENLPGRSHELMLLPEKRSCRDFPEIVIPAEHFFVMGDNRDDSFDSRYFGLVSGDQIFGRASRVVASFNPTRGYLPRSGRWLKPLV